MSIAAAAGTSALAVPACSEAGEEPEKRPNIVLIVADDLGIGDVEVSSYRLRESIRWGGPEGSSTELNRLTDSASQPAEPKSRREVRI